ncbi:hypothetical protein GGR57DRAFT_519337 [Xylariaceae sp. FL1272]|nr:hypothetical protein GGR57DRAFT_519337 [Xylariaceae sp. FL1272]
MSRINSSVTFDCGHKVNFGGRQSCFWILPLKGDEGFHMCYSSNNTRQSRTCPTCLLRSEIRGDADQNDLLCESELAQDVRTFTNGHEGSVQALTPAILIQIAIQLEQNPSVAAKLKLFLAILDLPSVFDRKNMIEFFASRYGEFTQYLEKGALIDAARGAGFPGVLSAGLRKSPMPLPEY